jgi:hypothetical protein
MSVRLRQRALVGGLAAVLVAGGGLAWWAMGHRPGAGPGTGPGPPRLAAQPGHLPVPDDSSKVAPPPVDEIMNMWRRAILARNPDDVLACDAIFRQDPGRYLQALVTSARTDTEPRVRAFSARVLGKLQDPALVPLFRRMLADDSPYVRENGAWALGELRSREATDELGRLSRSDPAEDVRKAAATALAQINATAGRAPR